MSELRVVMEAFVVGELDYAGLQRKLSDDLALTETYESALESLDVLCRSENLSPAMVNLLRRSIDRHFTTDNTDPFPDITPSKERARGTAEQRQPEDAGDLPPMYAEGGAQERVEPTAPGSEITTDELPAGAVLAGRYELEGLIGRGGSGLVYRAFDRCLATVDADNARVALKVLRPELAGFPPARARLVREGQAGLALRHPNLVRVIDVGMDGDRVFLTMELLEGDTLRAAIVKRSPDGFPAAHARQLIRGIGEGLAFLHERSMIHGDLKPGNVFLTSEGVPKLLDFGTSKSEIRAQEPTLEGGGAPPRTPAYASPELLAGESPEARDDVFALGCVACELASSRHPFGRVQSDEAKARKLRPALPGRLGARSRRALMAALAFRRRSRPADARAFLGLMGLGDSGSRRPAFATGLLAGVAIGVLLVLSIIHPQGPIGRLLPFDPQPDPTGPGPAAPAAGAQPGETAPASAEAKQAGSGGIDAPATADPPQTGIAGRFVPAIDPDETSGAADTADPQPEPEPRAATPPAPERKARPTGPGALRFSTAELSVTEGSAVAIATVSRTGGVTGSVSVRWRTVPGSAGEDSDYIASDWNRITLPDGRASERIYVPIVDDGLPEGEESFFIELADPGGGARLVDPSRLRVRITDDETG